MTGVKASSSLNYYYDYNFTAPIQQTCNYNYTCQCATLNVTGGINVTTNIRYYNITVPFSDAQSYNQSWHVYINGSTPMYLGDAKFITTSSTTGNWSGSSPNVLSQNIVLLLSNDNATQNLTLVGYDENLISFRFSSSYEKPETLILSYQGKNQSYSVFRDELVYMPLNLNYTSLAASIQTNQTALQTPIFYTIPGRNFSGNITPTITFTTTPDITLVLDNKQIKVDDLVTDKIVINSKIPIISANVTSDKLIGATTFIKSDGVYFYIMPHEQGEYNFNYTVTDFFGNSKSIGATRQVQPSAVIYFKNIEIPSLKTGEILKLPIYNGTPILINFTMTELNFTATAQYVQVGNQTVLVNQSSPVEKFTDIFLSDESGNNYFLTLNRTIIVQQSKLYLNFRGMQQGNYRLVFQVGVPSTVKANDGFSMTLKTGNVSIFASQTFNINGRITTCELTNTEDLDTSLRRCWTEFPLMENLDNNDVVLMSGLDFQRYETLKEYDRENLRKVMQDQITVKTRLMWLFIILFIISAVAFLYSRFPKDWLALPK